MHKNRFDPHFEKCIPLTVDRITCFFFNNYQNKTVVNSIKNVRQLIAFFRLIGLRVDGFYHPIFLLNPLYWPLFLVQSFKTTRHLQNKPLDRRSALLYFTSCYELYKVKEIWNHAVVELFNNDDRLYYDSYLEIIHKDHPELNIRIPNHNQLISSTSAIVLYIRRP